jgi:hypothetical protein
LDWVQLVPRVATLLGLLAGLDGLTIGRPVRAVAMIAGFPMTAAGLVCNWLIG